ncbi:MAG: disulfide bond formation protein B [Reyranellaceae bacterium]
MTGLVSAWLLQSPRHAALAPIAVSGGLLLGALAFQYLGGLAPCALCIDQRYAHGAALALAALGLAVRGRLGWTLVALAGAAMVVSAGIGVFHVGVEQKWWAGPTACSAANLSGLSPAEAARRLMETPVVRCDEIAWSLLGISMAGWNAIVSATAGLAVALFSLARLRQA